MLARCRIAIILLWPIFGSLSEFLNISQTVERRIGESVDMSFHFMRQFIEKV